MTMQSTKQNKPMARYVATVSANPELLACMTWSTDPDDLLGQVLGSLVYRRPLNALARRWLSTGILNAIRRGESLDKALSLGTDGLQRRLLMIQRNEHLAAAIRATALDDQVSDWQRCLRLVPEIKRFMRTWPITKKLSAPPADWPSFKCCLWRAAHTDMPLPQSADSLYRVLARVAAYPCKNSGAKLLSQFL